MDLYSLILFLWTRQLTDRAILANRQTQEKKSRFSILQLLDFWSRHSIFSLAGFGLLATCSPWQCTIQRPVRLHFLQVLSFFLKKLHFIFWALVLSSTLCLLGLQKLVALFALLGLCFRVWHLFCICSEKGSLVFGNFRQPVIPFAALFSFVMSTQRVCFL